MEEDDIYFSVARESKGLYKEKGSKFLAFAFPVTSETQARQILASLKKQYHDARHHCFAYMIGKDKMIFRVSDDGEPSHSAGDPILGQIKSKNLSDTLVVVVRYFGGTKLGVGGLINAYKTAAADAIAQNQIINKIVTSSMEIDFEYPVMNDVMKIIKAYNLTVWQQDFNLRCHIKFSVRKKHQEEVLTQLQKLGEVRLAD